MIFKIKPSHFSRNFWWKGGDWSCHKSEDKHKVLDPTEANLHRLGSAVCLWPGGGEESKSVLLILLWNMHEILIYLYTLPFKVLRSIKKKMFSKEICSVHQGCIYLIKNTVKTLILWNIITNQNNCFLLKMYLKIEFIPVLAKLNFLQSLCLHL